MKLPDGTTVNKYYSVASYGVRRAVRAATWPSREPGKTENTEPVAGESAEPVAGESAEPVAGESAEPVAGENTEPVAGESAEQMSAGGVPNRRTRREHRTSRT
jgi:hypothetical protein